MQQMGRKPKYFDAQIVFSYILIVLTKGIQRERKLRPDEVRDLDFGTTGDTSWKMDCWQMMDGTHKA